MKDVVIIGSGPAGMTAAIYAHAAGLSVTLIERGMYGGQMAVSSVIENYPGVGVKTGYELSDMMYRQVDACGILLNADTVKGIERLEDGFRVIGNSDEYEGHSVIIANGVKRREAGCEGEREFVGRGVSYCAVCDGGFFKGCDVCVIGGGNSALEEALYLSSVCRTVYLIHRREHFLGEDRYIKAIAEKH